MPDLPGTYGGGQYGEPEPPYGLCLEAPLGPSALVISPNPVDQAGGTEITITGTFTMGRAYAVTLNGRPCYSGVPGNGYLCRPINGTTLRSITPPVPSNEASAQMVVVSHALEVDQSGPLTVVEATHLLKIHRLRRSCPPWYRLGSRVLELESIRKML